MFFRNQFLTVSALVLALAAPARAEGPDLTTVVATVNGTDITLGHMVATKQNLPQQYQTLPDDVLFEGILDQLIQQTVLSDSVGDDLNNVAQLLIENEIRTIRAGLAIDRKIAAAVTEDAIAAEYTAVYAGIEPATEYNASHILVETQDEALALISELGGGADFAELAREKSTGPSGPNGGSLGWFTEGMMVPPFEAAVMALEIGAVSGPVETQFGWHVITLVETRLQDAPALDDVRGELAAGLQQAAIEDAVTALTEAAEVVRSEDPALTPAALSAVTLELE